MLGYKCELVRGNDVIRVEILEDGTIKTETDSVSAANHLRAENFLKEMFRLAGGQTEVRWRRPLAVLERDHFHHHHH